MAVDALLRAFLFEDNLVSDVVKSNDDDGSADVRDPVGTFLEKTSFNTLLKASIGDSSWDEPLAKTSKSERESWGDIQLGKSIEVVVVNGKKQVRYFDATGALCAVRIVRPEAA